ncbi:NAD(P)-binding protein [Penicillium capsulatum]|uniref:NAD(P)-binding protein n=1 Tax=Penicillium capsulatum TaxID=69766 RepID=A0A9W9LUT7_9EURO|nr:NAD(P)-binding protein [Penicillium capsulatum]
MTRVILTGGSGFIATHVLETLLARGHSVVTTVQTLQKAQAILQAHPELQRDRIGLRDCGGYTTAFDDIVVAQPPFDAVIYTASPYYFKAKDAKSCLSRVGDLADTQYRYKAYCLVAINETTGILESVQKFAPTVKRGERAAWNFIEKEKPSFDLSVINPPLVLGPIAHKLASLIALNTSNERIRGMISGASKDSFPPTGNYGYFDVRDLALAHVLAAEKPETGGLQFFTDRLPSGDALIPGDYLADGVYGFDNSRACESLGLSFRSLNESIVDAVHSLLAVEPSISS